MFALQISDVEKKREKKSYKWLVVYDVNNKRTTTVIITTAKKKRKEKIANVQAKPKKNTQTKMQEKKKNERVFLRHIHFPSRTKR